MKKTLVIIVSPSGEIQMDAHGFQGIDCEKATRFLEEVLGKISHRAKKPEYYQKRRMGIQQKLGQ
jgi:hypothetical protein